MKDFKGNAGFLEAISLHTELGAEEGPRFSLELCSQIVVNPEGWQKNYDKRGSITLLEPCLEQTIESY